MTAVQTQATAVEVDAVQAARAVIERERGVLANWQDKLAAAGRELESLQERAGAQILDNPGAAEDIEGKLTALEVRSRIAEKAIAAQLPRVMVAESRYISAEADVLEQPLEELRAELARHEAKTDRLLKQLVDHEGPYVPEVALIQAQRQLNLLNPPTSWQIPKSVLLQEEIERRSRVVEAMRTLAAGEDPAQLFHAWNVDAHTIWPSCVWGPDALVPAPSYLQAVERARSVVRELEELAAKLPSEVEKWETLQGEQPSGTILLGLERRRDQMRSVGQRLDEARENLAALQRRPAQGA